MPRAGTHAPTLERREPPLEPEAVAATGTALDALAAAVLARLESGAELRVCWSSSWLLVLGRADDLPWADGATYLARQDGLLLPTTRRAVPSAGLLLQALRRQVAPGADLLALVDGVVLASDAPLRPADPAVLKAALT